MREPTEQEPRYCPRVAWGGEQVTQRFPTHGAAECRVRGRGVEVHACAERAGHGENPVPHRCYCGQTWTKEGPDSAAPGGAAEKTAELVGEPTDSGPEGNSLGEVAMVGEALWREVHRRFYVAQESKLAISLALGLDRKTIRRLLQRETWRPYDRAAPALTLLTPFASFLTERAPRVRYPARILFQELCRASSQTATWGTTSRSTKARTALRSISCSAVTSGCGRLHGGVMEPHCSEPGPGDDVYTVVHEGPTHEWAGRRSGRPPGRRPANVSGQASARGCSRPRSRTCLPGAGPGRR